MVDININITKGFAAFEKVLINAIEGGLASRRIKTELEKVTIIQIEKALVKNQNLFRPDKGPGGGDELVGLLGAGQGGRPLTTKFRQAWKNLEPIIGANTKSTFRRRPRGKFGIINYEIDIDKFYNDFDATYISRKSGDADLVISWMQQLIDGIPTEQLRDASEGETNFVFVNSGPNFNPNFSRTGLGHMVPAGRLRIPARQFTFTGRGRSNTFGKFFNDIKKGLSSSAFRNNVEKRIAAIINSGG